MSFVHYDTGGARGREEPVPPGPAGAEPFVSRTAFPPSPSFSVGASLPTAPTARAPVRVRVLLADDDPHIREALSELINDEPGLELVGTAADAEEAVELFRVSLPDVVVLDNKMPAGGGAAALAGIKAIRPETHVVVLSAYDDDASRQTLSAAARYVVKGSAVDLLTTIKELV